MSGQVGYAEQLEALQKKLDEYEMSCGLPMSQFVNSKELEQILQIPLTELRKLGPTERTEYSFVLKQFSFHIQRKSNIEQSVITSCDKTIEKMFGPFAASAKGYSYDERVLSSLYNNLAYQKVIQIKTHAKLRLERLAFLTQRLDGLAQILNSFKRSSYE